MIQKFWGPYPPKILTGGLLRVVKGALEGRREKKVRPHEDRKPAASVEGSSHSPVPRGA